MGGRVRVDGAIDQFTMAAPVGDELAVADCDLDDCTSYKTTVFDFAAHRRPDQYGRLTDTRD